MGLGALEREEIAKRAAQEVKNGMIVNLGIGIPSLVPNFLHPGISVMIQSENGVLGIGETPEKGMEDENLCNAAGYPVTVVKGASYFDSAVSFGMIRKGCIDLTILGSLQVSQSGDLANWIVPGKKVPGMGGAMELAQKAKKVIVVMSHTDKNGAPKLLEACTLPLTAKACVDMVITDKAVFAIENNHFVLKELMNEAALDDVLRLTDGRVQIDLPFSQGGGIGWRP
ncbi:3-oxoacid CoA-transferase subunit B [Bacillus glycinifermentans]|uniref:CoA-transferase n=1 Tax=Bacillus glycinifermentans TaxID=1664069 RepID=A0A0T6BN23_9BACI|nr:3-oxoacid CoA-transferase subunit B [Bacillus glycinifermentans]ATH92068.1 acyl CoA:acetate/3-ketoacid CoA transferase subunit beta [Bacillus glycinifermentans]KRT93027.1 CoA-transferase [Bacillus glycinifermentans]MEC0486666.1 3-oxoacid CoA-transferase subunit B [Bacillus glycinifermentans]MEC0494771.1 3-oxoacid CoA-transferase subunit B [Bacillus glycinifermentans]MEC0541085.1 3-oxoacid CoA-transferase subunit B [Bacillus glycinifermentans]